MMFTIYKKIISPETSPVLGPATPRESSSAQSSSADIQSPKMQSMPTPMETFSLCDCCSTRTKQPQPAQPAQPAQSMQPAQQPEKPDSVYEFNHATHYTYNATTPRMVWEFDINVKPNPKH
jgi:hypothetical protein